MAGLGGDLVEHAQAPRPLALRALPPLPRDLLPFRRGVERHAVFGPRLGPRPSWRNGCVGSPRRTAADAAARSGEDRRCENRLGKAASRRLPEPCGRAAAERRGRARRAPSERTEPHCRAPRFMERSGGGLPRQQRRGWLPAGRGRASRTNLCCAECWRRTSSRTSTACFAPIGRCGTSSPKSAFGFGISRAARRLKR